MEKLFRDEAVNYQRTQLYGGISLSQPASLYVISAFFILSFLMIVIFCSTYGFSRVVSAQFYLTPDAGLIKVHAHRSGVIDDIYVKEGDRIEKMHPILNVVNRQDMFDRGELFNILVRELEIKMKTIEKERHSDTQLKNEKYLELKGKLAVRENVTSSILKRIKSLKKEFKIKEARLKSYKELINNQYISRIDVETLVIDLLTMDRNIEKLNSEFLFSNDEMISLKKEEIFIYLQYDLRNQKRLREESEIRSKISELSNKSKYIIRAPESGIVTTININKGMFVTNQKTVLNIIPENSMLEAELLLPSRSSGFIKIGDIVKLKLDAFPYQKFGFVQAKVVRIDKSLLLPNENKTPIYLNEPVYRVRAKIESQYILAYGRSYKMKSGMLGVGSIIQEKRTILQWLFEPIYSIKGRLME